MVLLNGGNDDDDEEDKKERIVVKYVPRKMRKRLQENVI